jgi:excinuclease ABC subunit B
MTAAAKDLDFETAAELRDRLIVVKGELGEKLTPRKRS